jgi:hypothetical protein
MQQRTPPHILTSCLPIELTGPPHASYVPRSGCLGALFTFNTLATSAFIRPTLIGTQETSGRNTSKAFVAWSRRHARYSSSLTPPASPPQSPVAVNPRRCALTEEISSQTPEVQQPSWHMTRPCPLPCPAAALLRWQLAHTLYPAPRQPPCFSPRLHLASHRVMYRTHQRRRACCSSRAL